MSEPANKPESSPERDAQGRLLPGHTANPSGRPHGLKKVIDELCEGKDPREIVEFHFQLMRAARAVAEKVMSGQKTSAQKLQVLALGAHAGKVLLWQRFGKPTQHVEISEDPATPEQVEARMRELGWQKVEQPPAEPTEH